MNNMKALLLISFILSNIAQAQRTSQNDRIIDTYLLTDKFYDIDCYIFKASKNVQITAKNKTRFLKQKLERDFSVKYKSHILNFNVSLFPHSNEEAAYKVRFEGGDSFGGIIDTNFKKGFYLEPASNNANINRYELNKLYCKINFAESNKTIINNSSIKLHINVHPHSNYDLFSETIKLTQNMHNNLKYKSMLLLEEEIDGKGNLVDLSDFLKTGLVPKLPLLSYQTEIKIPMTTELIVSAAGHNRYLFNSDLDTIEINYTGGNHNYCIWNNTRKLLTALIRSDSKSSLVINFHTKAIVAQRSGIIDGLSFKRKAMKDTRLLRTIFDNDTKTAAKYITNYFYYFSTSFINRNGFDAHYRTLTISTFSKMPLVEKTITLKGNGERDLNIILNYL